MVLRMDNKKTNVQNKRKKCEKKDLTSPIGAISGSDFDKCFILESPFCSSVPYGTRYGFPIQVTFL